MEMADLVLMVFVALGFALAVVWLFWRALCALARFCAARKFLATLVATMLLSTSAYAAYCPSFISSLVDQFYRLGYNSLKGDLKAVDKSLSKLLKTYTEKVVSAISVLTKQKSTVANQVGNSSRLQSQQVARGLGELRTSARLKAVRLNFGPEFGQGIDPCKTYTQRQIIVGRDADMASELRGRIATEVYAAPGVYMSAVESRKKLIEAHAPFCTQDQVNAGLCKKVGELAGASLSAGTLFNPAMGAETLYEAKSAYINNVVGETDSPVSEGAGQHAASSSYAVAKGGKDAIVSPAIVALKEVQLFNSGVEGAHSGTNLPMSMLLQQEIDRYAGDSPEYDRWSKGMAAQSPRGVMVELLKVEALRLAIAGKRLEAWERQEAMLAALVALELRRNQGGVHQDASEAMSKSTTRAIQ